MTYLMVHQELHHMYQIEGGSGDEIHIVVIDEDGEISGVKATVLETFEVEYQKAADAKTLKVHLTIIQM